MGVNWIAPGISEWSFRWSLFKQVLVITGRDISSETAIRWMSLDFTGDNSTLVQVMAWCRQATSHFLSQCWPRSVSPYVVTIPQWVNLNKNLNRNPIFFKEIHWICILQISCSDLNVLWMLKPEYSGKARLIPWRCSGPWRRQDISSHGIDCAECAV